MKNVFIAFMWKLNKVFSAKPLEFITSDLENVLSELKIYYVTVFIYDNWRKLDDLNKQKL